MDQDSAKENVSLKGKVRTIIFEAETPAGKVFDVALLWCISLSVLVVMLETVEELNAEYSGLLLFCEWFFTGVFTVEYVLRLWCSKRPSKYAMSFFGVVDLLCCLPAYIVLFFGSSSAFGIVRALRLLRMFRVLKMINHVHGADVILHGLARSSGQNHSLLFDCSTLSNPWLER